MLDVTMCRGDDCELRERCWRYKARPSRRQMYFTVAPMELDGSCEYLIETRFVATMQRVRKVIDRAKRAGP